MATVPRFYAELLENIKSIAISIDLPSPSDPTTRLDLTSSALLTVHHNGQSTLITLPGNVAPLAARVLQRPVPGQEKLSYRLPVAPSPPPPPHLPADGLIPWTAMELNRGLKNVAFTCRACNAEVIPKGKMNTWKDLPSSNWADMMDFWHCHKPDPSDSRQGGGGGTNKYSAWQKGYTIEAGSALVDLTRFLLDERDCVDAVEALEVILTSPLFLVSCNGQKEGHRSTKCARWPRVSIQMSYIKYPTADNLDPGCASRYPRFNERWVLLRGRVKGRLQMERAVAFQVIRLALSHLPVSPRSAIGSVLCGNIEEIHAFFF